MTEMVPDWLSGGWLIARVNARRQVRKARTHPWIAFFQVFTLFFAVVVAAGELPIRGYAALWGVPGGYAYGRHLAEDPAAVLATVRGFTGVAFVLLVFLTVIKEVTDGAMDSHVDALLLAGGPRTVAVGGVLWSLLLTGWQFGALVVTGALAFGAGAGSPLLAVTLAVAGLAALVTAVPLGFVLSLVVRLAFREVGVIRNHRILLGGPLAVVYFSLFVQVRNSMAVLSDLPVGWYADAGLVAATDAADPLRAALALGTAPVAAVGLTALAVPLGARLWYGDDPSPGTDEGDARAARTAMDHLLPRAVPRPTAAVVRTVWRRLRREPRTLVFALLPVAITSSVGIELVRHRPATLPVVIGVYGGAAIGMGATLNPLGSAGAGLPAALTTPGGGRYLVRGYVLSAALPGVPLVAGLALLAGLVTPLGLPTALAMAGLAAVLATTAAVVSMAVGAAVPNMEGLRPSGSGIRPPNLWATTAFLFLMALVGTPALVGVGWAAPIATRAGLPPGAVAAAGVGGTLLLAGATSAVAYRRALTAIAGYTVE